MLSEKFSQHQHHRNLDELGRLELAQGAGQFNPATLAVDLQADAGNQHYNQQDQSNDVKYRRQLNQPAVVAEGDGRHRDHGDAQTDQLLLPVGFRWLRVANFPGAEANDRDRQHGDQPIEIPECAAFYNFNHDLYNDL